MKKLAFCNEHNAPILLFEIHENSQKHAVHDGPRLGFRNIALYPFKFGPTIPTYTRR